MRLMKNPILIAIFAVFPTGFGMAQQPAPVKVEGGLLEGTSEDGLTVYRGIPFAAPPVGNLRWRAPQTLAKWEGIRRADKFAPECMQAGGRGAVMTEDCLYLNIWTPAKSPNERIPVLVWITGAGSPAALRPFPRIAARNWRNAALSWSALRIG